MQQIRTSMVALALFCTTTDALAEDISSGSSYIDGCTALIEHNSQATAFDKGMCAGAMQAIFALAPTMNICPPAHVSGGQAVRIVVKYLSNNPEMLHKHFTILALTALKEAWPCSKIN